MNAQPGAQAGSLSEALLLSHLEKHVYGHALAKKKLATVLTWNQRRSRYLRSGVSPVSLPQKLNCLFLGPTGQGKTLIVRTAAAQCGVPFFGTSATSYSSVGYVGLNVEDMVGGLLGVAHGNTDLASRGIIFIDEI